MLPTKYIKQNGQIIPLEDKQVAEKAIQKVSTEISDDSVRTFKAGYTLCKLMLEDPNTPAENKAKIKSILKAASNDLMEVLDLFKVS